MHDDREDDGDHGGGGDQAEGDQHGGRCALTAAQQGAYLLQGGVGGVGARDDLGQSAQATLLGRTGQHRVPSGDLVAGQRVLQLDARPARQRVHVGASREAPGEEAGEHRLAAWGKDAAGG